MRLLRRTVRRKSQVVIGDAQHHSVRLPGRRCTSRRTMGCSIRSRDRCPGPAHNTDSGTISIRRRKRSPSSRRKSGIATVSIGDPEESRGGQGERRRTHSAGARRTESSSPGRRASRSSRLRVRSLLVPHSSARTTPDSRRIRKCLVMAEAASGVSIAPQACERPSDNCRTTDSLTGSASACRTVTRRMSPALG